MKLQMNLLTQLIDGVHWALSRLFLRSIALVCGTASPQNPDTLFVLRNCFFGDFIVAVPALRRLRAAFPDTEIVFLTATSFAPGWRDRPQDDAIFQIEPGLIDRVVRYTGQDLRTRRARAALQRELARPGTAATVALVYAADSLTSRCKRLLLCRVLGLPFPHGLTAGHTLPAQTRLNRWRLQRTDVAHQKDAALASADELLAAAGVRGVAHDTSPNARRQGRSGPPTIGVAPFSKQPVKQWPVAHFAALMVELHETLGARFEVYGAPGEVALAAELDTALAGRVPVASLCGKLSPAELRWHIENIDVLVALDSGPMHLASLVNTPVVALFAQITLHAFWRPWGVAGSLVAHDVPCRACNTMDGECPLQTKACIDGIAVDKVLQQVMATLRGVPRP